MEARSDELVPGGLDEMVVDRSDKFDAEYFWDVLGIRLENEFIRTLRSSSASVNTEAVKRRYIFSSYFFCGLSEVDFSTLFMTLRSMCLKSVHCSERVWQRCGFEMKFRYRRPRSERRWATRSMVPIIAVGSAMMVVAERTKESCKKTGVLTWCTSRICSCRILRV